MRLRGTDIKILEEEGLDTDGAVESISKLQSKIQALSGVNILTDSGEYKSTYEILSQIATVWQDISDTDQAALLELIAGKRSGSVMSAILQNPETLKDAFESANEASGSANKELEKYLDSIQGKIDQFTNATQTMWNNALDSDVVKFFIQAATSLVKLVDNVGLGKIAFIGLFTFLERKYNFFSNFFKPAKTGVEQLRAQLAAAEADLQKAEKAHGLKGSKKTSAKVDAKKSQVEILKQQIEPYEKAQKELLDKQKAFEKAQNRLNNYQGNNQKTISNYTSAVNKTKKELEGAKQEADKLGVSLENTGKKGASGFKKIGAGAKAALKSIKSIATQMLAMYAVTVVLELLGKAVEHIKEKWTGLQNTVEKAQEEFEKLSGELSTAESELRSLESELETTQDRMDEFLELGKLSFVEQEELNNLRKQSSELETQIELANTLVETLEKAAGLAAMNAAQKTFSQTSFYSDKSKTERQEEAEETGKTIGQVAGAAIALGIGALLAAPTGGLSLGVGAAVAGGGALAGGFAGELIGSASATSEYDSEKTVADVLSNMRGEREALEKARDDAYKAYTNSDGSEAAKKQWEEAQAALGNYDSTLAQHVSQMQQYLNSVDPSKLENSADKAYYEQMKRWVDSYTVMMGGPEGVSSVISSIFNEETMSQGARDLMNAINNALEDGEYIDFTNFQGDEFAGIREELDAVGVSITQVISYFEALAEVKDVSTYYETSDIVKSISKLSSGIKSLKDAFDEFNESGLVTAETLVKLSETFGNLDGWENFLDVMSSGVSSTEEVKDVIGELAEDYLSGILTNPFKFVDDPETDKNERIEEYKNYITTISQLQSLGVTNAKELVDAMNQEVLTKSITSQIETDKKRIDELMAKENLSAKEESELAELRTKNTEDYIEAAEKEYGIKLANNELVEKQNKLNKVSVDNAEIQKIKNDDFSSNNLLKQYDDSIEEQKSLQKQLEDLVDKKEGLENTLIKGSGGRDGWSLVPIVGDIIDTVRDHKAWGERNDTIDEYDSQIETTEGLIAEEKEKRQELFNDLVEYANEYGVDLSGIDLTAFDASQTGEGSIFKQVYDAVKPVIEAEAQALAEEEERLKEEIGTAFDAIGLEVTIELQDKSKLVDDIQSIYDELKNAQKEYAENGYLSVDTMQSLLQLEPKYLDMLVDENGNLNLNEQALLDVARARIIDLGIKQQSAILDQALALATSGSAEAIMEQVSVMETATEVSGDWVEAKMAEITAMIQARVAAGDLTQAEADAFIEGTTNQIKAVQATTNAVLKDLGNSLSNAGNTTQAETEDKFQKAMDYWENQIQASESRADQVQNEIDALEAKGQKAGANYYGLMIDEQNRQIDLLNSQRAEALAYLQELEASGEKGSEKWWEIAQVIDGIDASLDDATATLQDYNDAMADLHWYGIDEASTRVDNLTKQLQNVRDILSNEDMFDENGDFTKEGVASLASYIQELGLLESALESADTNLAMFGDSYDPNKAYVDENGVDLGIQSEQEWYEARQKSIDQYDEYNSAIVDTKYAIKDMYEQQVDAIESALDAEIEAYNDYIDVLSESLDAERDLFEFKKSIQKQNKDIAETERKLASLSGSTNAADIAERRKLEAQLADQKEGINDSYYQHANDQRSEALSNEAQAFEDSANRYVEGLRDKLDASFEDWYLHNSMMSETAKETLDSITTVVVQNAGSIVETYTNTGATIDSSLMTPWVKAASEIEKFGGADGALALMNKWTQSTNGAPFYDFSTNASDLLKQPWTDATVTANTFKSDVGGIMDDIYKSISSNVDNSVASLQKLIDKMKETTDTDIEYNGGGNGGGGGGEGDQNPDSYTSTATYTIGIPGSKSAKVVQKTATAATKAKANDKAKNAVLDAVEHYYRSSLGWSQGLIQSKRQGVWTGIQVNAKGTLGTKKDGWNITDESWIGEEITLAAGKNGQLQYLKKGSAVIPADISANLVEWGKMNPADMMSNNIIQPVVTNVANNAQTIQLNIDALVKADTITDQTLPKLEKMMDKKINDLTQKLNYGIKKYL